MTPDEAAVLDALHRMGAARAYELRNELGIRSARVYRALEALMAAGVVVDEWESPELAQSQGREPWRYYQVKEERTVGDVVRHWTPGSEAWSWADEAADLIERQPALVARLVRSIATDGLRAAREGEDPIVLGDDGRVWEGHHRIVAALIVDRQTPLPGDVVVVFGFTSPNGTAADRPTQDDLEVKT